MAKILYAVVGIGVAGVAVLYALSNKKSIEHNCPSGYHWDEIAQECTPDDIIPAIPPAHWYLHATANIINGVVGGTVTPTWSDGLLSNTDLSPYITAQANNGYKFDHWEFNGTIITWNKTPSIQLSLNPAIHPDVFELVAIFVSETPTCPVGYHWDETQSNCVPNTTPIYFTVITEPTNGGITNPSPNTYEYTSPLTVTAQPYPNFVFQNWKVNDAIDGDVPSFDINDIRSDLQLTAVFRYIPPLSEYTLDVGFLISGTPPYFNVQDCIAEFKNFIEQNSKFRLNITATTIPPLATAEYMSGLVSGSSCMMPTNTTLSANTKSYLTHRVNILCFDPQTNIVCYEGLGGYIPANVPGIVLLNNWNETPWSRRLSAAIVHEFIHTIGLNADSCPSLGYNQSNDPGWQNCYKYLLSQLTDEQYHQIVGY